MSILRNSPETGSRRQFESYDQNYRGVPAGQYFTSPNVFMGQSSFKGGGATVLIYSKTGWVLLAIHEE